MKLHNKVAIVTGGGRGIGKAVVKKLVDEGAKVLITSRNVAQSDDSSNSEEPVNRFTKVLNIDVTEKQQVLQVVNFCLEEWGKIDILINNAGVSGIAKLKHITDDLWDNVFNVNVRSVYWFIQAITPYLIHNTGGRVINISSQAGKAGEPYNSVYSASKFAVIGLTQSLAIELAPFNITVNAVCPGNTETEMHYEAMREYNAITNTKPDQDALGLLKRIPLGRIGKPEEIANVVAFLASEEASYITGASIPVNGGSVMF